MRNKKFMKKMLAALFAFTMACMVTPSTTAEASTKTYTVTFRPGNVGEFAVSDTTATSKQAKAQEVADLLYGGYSDAVATENGAIKVTVEKGQSAPSAPAYIVAGEGYFFMDASEWGPDGSAVTKNADYVVDYGKLIDGVEYTVRYVDVDSQAQIAPVSIQYGNIGVTYPVSGPSTLTISEDTQYVLVSTRVGSITLSSDSTQNVFAFEYQAVPAGTVIEEVINYVDGDTVIISEPVTPVAEGAADAAAVTPVVTPVAADAGAITIPDDNTPLDPGAADEITIDDEETPLNPGEDNEETQPGSDEEEIITIEDEETALLDSIGDAETGIVSRTPVILAAVAGVAVVAAAGIWLVMRKKANAQGSENNE